VVCAACTNKRRRYWLPVLLMLCSGSELPDWLCWGRKPRNAPTDRLKPSLPSKSSPRRGKRCSTRNRSFLATSEGSYPSRTRAD
jgi:hypothetical protein